jgi:hypothetical protein
MTHTDFETLRLPDQVILKGGRAIAERLIHGISKEDTRRFEALIEKLPPNFNKRGIDPMGVLDYRFRAP